MNTLLIIYISIAIFSMVIGILFAFQVAEDWKDYIVAIIIVPILWPFFLVFMICLSLIQLSRLGIYYYKTRKEYIK